MSCVGENILVNRNPNLNHYLPYLVLCFFSIFNAGDRRSVRDLFMYQSSPLLPVSCQLWTIQRCSAWPVFDIICSSLPRFARSRWLLFWHFSAQISGLNHITKILKLASLCSCWHTFLLLYFLHHWCMGPVCHPTHPHCLRCKKISPHKNCTCSQSKPISFVAFLLVATCYQYTWLIIRWHICILWTQDNRCSFCRNKFGKICSHYPLAEVKRVYIKCKHVTSLWNTSLKLYHVLFCDLPVISVITV